MSDKEMNEGRDKAERLIRGDRTSEKSSQDSVISGDRKEHQEIHYEAARAGHTFDSFSDNHWDQSFKAIQPAADTFGIDFGDGTIETSKGKVTKPQDQILASNVIPSSSETSLPNLEEVKDSDESKHLLAQDFKRGYGEFRKSLQGAEIVRMAQSPNERLKHPHKGNEDYVLSKVPDSSWKEAYKLFPEFKKSGVLQAGLTEDRIESLSKAVIRNELSHYDWRDALDDKAARITGNAPDVPNIPGIKGGRPSDEATLGIVQVSPKGLIEHRGEFPQLDKYLTGKGYPPGSEVKALLDPKIAPAVVAANFAHNIKMYSNHLRETEISAKSLAYGFNPSESGPNGKILLPSKDILSRSKHVENVMNALKIIDSHRLKQP